MRVRDLLVEVALPRLELPGVPAIVRADIGWTSSAPGAQAAVRLIQRTAREQRPRPRCPVRPAASSSRLAARPRSRLVAGLRLGAPGELSPTRVPAGRRQADPATTSRIRTTSGDARPGACLGGGRATDCGDSLYWLVCNHLRDSASVTGDGAPSSRGSPVRRRRRPARPPMGRRRLTTGRSGGVALQEVDGIMAGRMFR